MSQGFELTVSSQPLESVESELLAIPVFFGETGEIADDWPVLGQAVQIAQREAFKGREGEALILDPGDGLRARRLCFVGLGKRADWSLPSLRGIFPVLASQASGRGLDRFSLATDPLTDVGEGQRLAALAAEGAVYGAYRFDRYKRPHEPSSSNENGRDDIRINRVELVGMAPSQSAEGVRRGRVLGEAVCLARDWVNEPPNVCTPSFLAAEAARLADEVGLEAAILRGLDSLETERMGLFAAVAKGSFEPPAFIHLVYRSPDRPSRRVALVGKGVTYDSGGYSMKPAPQQIGMHGDMAGGAAVLATAKAIGELAPDSLEAHFIVPAAENLVSGQAYRVNDVIVGRSGRTVEVANTDAEGRLLLADALAFASELEVDAIVDIATLTGGNFIAFGGVHAGVLSNDDRLAFELLAAARAAGEQLWQLPLTRRLEKKLKSGVADIKNSGGREGGTITAALFLEKFVGGVPWAHIDMAGLELGDEPWQHIPKGATGFGVTSLCNFLLAASHGWGRA